jgi:hypothetical protein
MNWENLQGITKILTQPSTQVGRSNQVRLTVRQFHLGTGPSAGSLDRSMAEFRPLPSLATAAYANHHYS